MIGMVLVLVALLWGPVSAVMFFEGWLSFLGIVACLIGLVRGRVSRHVVLTYLFGHFTRSVFFGLALFMGFFFLFRLLPLGRTSAEMVTYWLSSLVAVVVLITRISKRIDLIWAQANGLDDE